MQEAFISCQSVVRVLEFSSMTEETDKQTVYEIGFHLIPQMSEDEVPSHVDEIKTILDKAGAEIISEGFPTLIDLAYAISTTVSGAKEEFDTAYFGWIKFEADPAAIEKIDERVREKQEILRSVFVKTLREDTVASAEETAAEEGEGTGLDTGETGETANEALEPETPESATDETEQEAEKK